MKILIFGLSGTGKTVLAEKLYTELGYSRVNGDDVRTAYNDWDFSIEGRIRQAGRIADFANNLDDSIIDFIAPLTEMRETVDADFVIWMNTKQESEYSDTDKLFETPDHEVNMIIQDWDYDVQEIVSRIADYREILWNNI